MLPEIDRLTEIVVLLKRRRAVSFEDIEWMCEEIVRLRETLNQQTKSSEVQPSEQET